MKRLKRKKCKENRELKNQLACRRDVPWENKTKTPSKEKNKRNKKLNETKAKVE